MSLLFVNHVFLTLDLPGLGDMRLALLGPRIRRTLYRQDREKIKTEQITNEESQEDQAKATLTSSPLAKRNPNFPSNIIRHPIGPSDSNISWRRTALH